MAQREFHDHSGRCWTVWDVHPIVAERLVGAPASSGIHHGISSSAGGTGGRGHRTTVGYVEAGLAAGWLCFESPEGKRRLAPIPAGWEGLPSDSLLTLFERATPVPPPRRRAP